ncbi:MAG: hypothetical protein DRJ69_05545, partial [Thermoprotei archaeon]
MRPSRALLLLLTLTYLLAVLSPGARCESPPLSMDLQLPLGNREEMVYVAPNSTVVGVVVVESRSSAPLNATLYVEAVNCTLLTLSHRSFTLRTFHDSRALPVKVVVGEEPCRLVATCAYDGGCLRASKLLVPTPSWNASVRLIIPSDPFGSLDEKCEPFTVVAKPSRPPLFIRLLTGEERRGHSDLLTLACVEVEGPGRYTVVLVFEASDGSLLPVSSTSLGGREVLEANYGVVTISGVAGGSRVVVPLFTPAYPESLVGEHRVAVLLYPFGCSTPIANATYPLKVVSVGLEAAILAAFSGLVALPAFIATTAHYVKRSELKDLVLCALLGCLTFTVVTVPGQVVWGLASFLGPFDWLVTGLIYDVLLYALYVAAVALRPRLGTLTMVMFVKWIMYSLFFGRLSIISALWLATSALFFEPLLYALGVTRRGVLRLERLLLAFVPAALVDKYVDLMLYAALYRLYYADWYVASYSIGGALYTVPGIV